MLYIKTYLARAATKTGFYESKNALYNFSPSQYKLFDLID